MSVNGIRTLCLGGTCKGNQSAPARDVDASQMQVKSSQV